jgi:hypothetical protein
VGLNTARRQFARRSALANQIETARAVAEMQMQDAGLAGHHAGDVTLGCDAQQLIERRLARSMIADRDFADADQRFARIPGSPRTLPVSVAGGTC